LLHFRFLFTIAAAGFGFYGMILLAVLTLLHVTSLRSFGIPFMRPLAPVSFNDLKDVFMRAPIHLMRTRPDSLEGGNRVRQKIKARQYFYKYKMWEDE